MIIPEDHVDNILLLGIINFTDLISENEISRKNNRFNAKSIGECKIEIYGPNEGAVPHMHIYNSDRSFEACVCIYSNNYFSHCGKYNSKFNSKQCKEFNEWMKQPNTKTFNKLTNWEASASLWEAANPDCKFPEKRKVTVQPHYENMINFIDE